MKTLLIFALLLMPLSAIAMDPMEYNLEMQRMQLEQARIQANSLAMFGMGMAFVNGMNQALHSMQLPMPVMPTIQPYQPVPARAPVRCVPTNPGAMSSTFCY